jgi:hypothetical protein
MFFVSAARNSFYLLNSRIRQEKYKVGEGRVAYVGAVYDGALFLETTKYAVIY